MQKLILKKIASKESHGRLKWFEPICGKDYKPDLTQIRDEKKVTWDNYTIQLHSINS
jgi:hypothetical protein